MKCVDKDAAVVEQEEIPEIGPNGELPTRYIIRYIPYI